MSDKKLEKVYVTIYSKKMLKEAIKHLKNNGQKVQNTLNFDWYSDNYYLTCFDGEFGLTHGLKDNMEEITLSKLVEMVIDLEEKEPIKHVIGKWYKNDYGSIVNYQGGRSGFGLASDGDWYNNNYWSFESFKYEATDQEVSGMLIKEAQKRGFKGGVKFSLGKYVYEMPHKLIFKYFPKGNTLGANHVTIPHLFPQIFNNGKWAEIIEQDKFAELKEAFVNGAKIEVLTEGETSWVQSMNPQWNPKREYRIKPEESKVKLGDYVVTELKDQPSPGFGVYQLVLQDSVDALNSKNSFHNFKVITKEKFDQLRGLCFD